MLTALNGDKTLLQANGGFIMSASHNPGGPEYDWGIKVISKQSLFIYLFIIIQPGFI